VNYTKSNNTYFAEPQSNPKDRISVEIGDSKDSKFQPQMKIMRWDNEVNFSARLKTDKIQNPVKDGDKIKTDNIHFYELDEGYEFEVILAEKPKSNVIEFTIEDKGISYYYQPELTQEEIAQGAERPENVIGSYAVYTSEQKINYQGQKEYKCGKVGHIYRPRIEDANGDWTWGDLKIEKGILSVTISQEFLDKAVYPVRHAAGFTFGFTGAGLSAGASSGACYGSHATGAAGTATKITILVPLYSGSAYRKYGLYTDGSTLTLVTNGNTDEVYTPNNASDISYDFTFSSNPTISAVEYWIIGFPSTSETGVSVRYDAGDANIGMNKFSTNGNPPATITSHTLSTRKMSIYCTYTSSGGTAWSKDFTETVTPSETLAKSFGVNKTESSTIGESLNTTFTGAWSKTLTESVTPSEVLTKFLVKNLTESATPSEALIKSMAVNRTESVTPSEALVKAIAQRLTESVGASDDLNSTFAGALSQNLNDTINVSEVLTQAAVYGRSLTDTVTVTDNLVASLNQLSSNYFVYEGGVFKLIVNGHVAQIWQ